MLEKELDWDSEGVDKDLVEIADKMIHWEEKGLHSLLELSHIDVHDIKDAYRDKPVLQRCVKFKVHGVLGMVQESLVELVCVWHCCGYKCGALNFS